MTNVSLEIFQSPIRMTHCGHMYCEKCLLNISKGQQRWHCPDCQTLQNCAVNSLPRNYRFEKFVEKFKKNQSKPEPENVFGTCKKHDRAIEYRKQIFHKSFRQIVRILVSFENFKVAFFMAKIHVLIVCLRNCVVILRKQISAIL